MLDCTPVSSNPQAIPMFFFNGSVFNDSRISVFVLNISSIGRKERGNYSCFVSNGIGNATAEVVVNVNGEMRTSLYGNYRTCVLRCFAIFYTAPPTVPQSLSFSNIQPFSSTVSWSAPEDNGGDLNPPTYRINLIWSNGTMTMYTSTDLMLQLTNLWHSRNYTVSVVAVNKYGTSPPAERVLTTNDSGKAEYEC